MVVMVILSVLVFFLFGYLCGYLHKKCKLSLLSSNLSPQSQDRTVMPIGEEHNTEEQDSQDLEMTDNVAYGPVKINL